MKCKQPCSGFEFGLLSLLEMKMAITAQMPLFNFCWFKRWGPRQTFRDGSNVLLPRHWIQTHWQIVSLFNYNFLFISSHFLIPLFSSWFIVNHFFFFLCNFIFLFVFKCLENLAPSETGFIWFCFAFILFIVFQVRFWSREQSTELPKVISCFSRAFWSSGQFQCQFQC